MTRETGLIFSANMALANIEGRKTMTRRTQGLEFINGDPDAFEFVCMENDIAVFRQIQLADITMLSKLPPLRSFPKSIDYAKKLFRIKCPFGQIGDGIWQREAWATERHLDHLSPSEIGEAASVPLWYRADDKQASLLRIGRWRPSIFMPKWASRWRKPITSAPVPVRLQEITMGDAVKEGFAGGLGFGKLWDFYNAAKGLGWDFNPWVWPIGYENELH